MKSHLLDMHLERHPGAGAIAGGIEALLEAGHQAIATVQTWNHRRRGRRSLAGLDDHLLRDIGVDRHQALAEASKPFWRG